MSENDRPINDPSEVEKLIGDMKTGSAPYLLDLCDLLGLGVVVSWEDAFDELKLRLMPKGMEWPRYEGGEPVLIADEADGMRVDEVRFGVGDIGGCTIFQVGPDGLNERVRPVEPGERLKRSDSWERLEDDASKSACEYFGHKSDGCAGCPAIHTECEESKSRDLVLRAKTLAERGQ